MMNFCIINLCKHRIFNKRLNFRYSYVSGIFFATALKFCVEYDRFGAQGLIFRGSKNGIKSSANTDDNLSLEVKNFSREKIMKIFY